MKTIKIIDLLNKIANGEEVPEKIKFRSTELNFDKNYNRYVNYNGKTIGELIPLDIFLDEETEIIEEEKEIEKIPYCYSFGFIDCGGLSDVARDELDKNFNYFKDKINELIDAVNEIRKEN